MPTGNLESSKFKILFYQEHRYGSNESGFLFWKLDPGITNVKRNAKICLPNFQWIITIYRQTRILGQTVPILEYLPLGDLVAITLRQKAEKCNRSGLVGARVGKVQIEDGDLALPPSCRPLSLHLEVIIVTNSKNTNQKLILKIKCK